MIKEASRYFFRINDCEEQADQVADTLQGKIYSNCDIRVITNDFERLTDQVEVEASGESASMELSRVAEEAEIERHDKDYVKPEACHDEWTQYKSPNFTLSKGQVWIGQHEGVRRVREPGDPVEDEASGEQVLGEQWNL